MNSNRTFWKRLATITMVASLVAVMAAPAFAQQRRERRERPERPRINIDLDDYEFDGSIRDRIRDRIDRRRPVSSVPEPSAALLFAGGGLIVAQAIRSNRRKNKK